MIDAPTQPATAAPAWEERPVFVTGLMKTGSTLLLALFDGHPNLVVYPDEPSFERLFGRRHENGRHRVLDWLFGTPNPLHYNSLVQEEVLSPLGFDPKSWEAIPKSADVAHLDVAGLRRRIRLRGVDERDQREALDLVRYHEELESQLSRQADPSPKDIAVATIRAVARARGTGGDLSRWLFKQPLPRYRSSSFEWFFDAFAEGTVVVLMRDPRGYVNSLIDYARKRRRGRPGAVWRALFLLRRLHDLEADYLAFSSAPDRLGRGRVMLAYYERIIEHTPGAMDELCDALGLPPHRTAHAPSKMGREVRVPTATQTDGSRVYKEATARWARDLSRLEILLIETVLTKYFDEHPEPYRPTTPRLLRKVLRVPLRVLCNAVAGRRRGPR